MILTPKARHRHRHQCSGTGQRATPTHAGDHAATDLPIQAPRTSQRRVNGVGSVGGGHHHDTTLARPSLPDALHAIHEREQLCHDAGRSVARLLPPRAQRVHLVQEHDGNGGPPSGSLRHEGARLAEHGPQLCLTFAHHRTHNLCGGWTTTTHTLAQATLGHWYNATRPRTVRSPRRRLQRGAWH